MVAGPTLCSLFSSWSMPIIGVGIIASSADAVEGMATRTPDIIDIKLDAPPEEVARGLCHLPGLVFLDSSIAEESDTNRKDAAFSLVAALPSEFIKGNFFDPDDRDRLRSLWEKNLVPAEFAPDLGVPLGGLIGYIEYDGKFIFGCYPEMLIYNHHSKMWLEIGNLSKHYDCTASLLTPERIDLPEFTSKVNREEYCSMVRTALDYIAAGDIYQVNLAHRFRTRLPADFVASFDLYRHLREASPSPFASYLNLGNRQIMSSSPEQFLQLSGNTIQTRPIKGTRPRFRNREKDEKSAYDLITSPKEVSELIMITDLERNDLGQVCEFGSVQATDLLKLERYAQVFHLVSTVEGTLRGDVDHIHAVHACFPGGSITGAPKKRAREIIAELEPEPRGLYTGAIGCFGFNGESRFNIAIRTAIAEKEALHFHVGAGIVADSIPEMEWEETLHKAAGIFRACNNFS